MAMEVHGHGARMIQYAADDSGNGATVGAAGQGASGTDNSGSQGLTAQERLNKAMAELANAKKNKGHADRKITQQGQETARLRQELEAERARRAAVEAQLATGAQSGDDMFSEDTPNAQFWAEQRQFNEEVAQRMEVLTQSAKHLLSGQVAARQDEELSETHLTKVRSIYGTSLEPKVEAYLVEASKSGDPFQLVQADKLVREALFSGAAEATSAAVAEQAGIGGASGVASGEGSGTTVSPPSGELTEDDWAEIKRSHPNDKQGQMAASMMRQLEALESSSSNSA